MGLPLPVDKVLRKLAPKPAEKSALQQILSQKGEHTEASGGDTTASTPTPFQQYFQEFNNDSKGSTSATLNDNPLAADLDKTFGSDFTLFPDPHCDTPGCRLTRGCDVEYNPHYDDEYLALINEERIDHWKEYKQPQKYKSPFQFRVRSSPKRRKTSHDSSVDGVSPDEAYDYKKAEPAAAFSQKSWLALEFFLLVRRNLDVARGRGELAMKAVQRLFPDLDYEGCVAMDLLRLNYPEPNIYGNDDEDESTEGAKLHKLHLVVYDMMPEDLNEALDELCKKLSAAGYRHHSVLLGASMTWSGPREDYPYDDRGYNYTLLGASEGESWPISPVYMKHSKADGSHVFDHRRRLREYKDEQQEPLERRRQAIEEYRHRCYVDEVRTKAAHEAIRFVCETEGQEAYICSLREANGLHEESLKKSGESWPPLGSRWVNTDLIEPRQFAQWVDGLAEELYDYAENAIHKWRKAGEELFMLLGEPETTGASTLNGEGVPNSMPGMHTTAPSPKRKQPSWPSEEEEPSNSPPDLYEEERQLRQLQSMSEAEALEYALKMSMGDLELPAQQPQPQLPAPFPAPAISRRRNLTRSEQAEFENRGAEWYTSENADKEFPAEEVKAEIIRKSEARKAQNQMTLPSHSAAGGSRNIPYIQLPRIDEVISSSPPRRAIVVEDADGADSSMPDIGGFANGIGSLFKDSYVRGRSRSRSPPKSSPSRSGGIRIADLLNSEVNEEEEIVLSVEIVEIAGSEESDRKKQLAQTKDELGTYKKDIATGVDGAISSPPSIRSISSASSGNGSAYESAMDRSPGRSVDEGRTRSIGDVLNSGNESQYTSPYVEDQDAAQQRGRLRQQIYSNAANFASNSDGIPNPFRRVSNRNRGNNLSQEDRVKVERWTTRARAKAGEEDAVGSPNPLKINQSKAADLQEITHLERLQRNAAYREEFRDIEMVNADLEAQIRALEQGYEGDPQADLRALEEQARLVEGSVLRESDDTRKERWRSEDKEWDKIIKSDKWLGEILLTGDVRTTRRCDGAAGWFSALESGWIERAERKENAAFPGVLDSNAAAIAAAKRPSEARAVGGDTLEDDADLTEPFPDHVDDFEFDEAAMPAGDVGAPVSTAWPNETTGEVVVNEDAAVNGEQMGARSGPSMDSAREILADIGAAFPSEVAVWEEAVFDDGDVKVPGVEVAELKPEDLAKEA